MRDLECEPEHFTDRIIFMSMYKDIEWKAKRNRERREKKHTQLRIMLADSLAVIGLSWGLDQMRSGTELTVTDLMDHGINMQRKMMARGTGPQCMSARGGGGLVRVPNLRVCRRLRLWSGTCREGRAN